MEVRSEIRFFRRVKENNFAKETAKYEHSNSSESENQRSRKDCLR
jgi:hypothetical protein